MLPRLLIILLALAAATARPAHASRPAAVPDVIDSLVVHGSDRGQFLAIVLHQAKSDGSLQPVSTVHFRPPGGGSDAWVRFAQFDARVLALAEWSGELAVLLETAQTGPDRTQVRYIHNAIEGGRSSPTDIPGPAVPQDLTIADITGGAGGTPLFALAMTDDGAGVLALVGTQWRQLSPLPAEIAALEQAKLAVGSTSGKAALAARTSQRQVAVFLHEDDQWRRLGSIEIEPDEQFVVLSGQDLPATTVYVFGPSDRLVQLTASSAATQGSPRSQNVEFTSPPGVSARFAGEDPRAAAVAMGSLRLARASFTEARGRQGNHVLIEMAMDPSSLELVGDGSAVLLSFPALTPQELRDQIMMLALYGLLVIAVIAVLRQRPMPPAERLREVAQQLAPFSLRAGAGLIDAIPLAVAAGAWWLTREAADPTQEWLIGVAGVIVYMVHTTASEVVTGRTLGKALFRLRVVKTDGTPAGPGAIILRNLLRPLDAPTAGLGLALLNPLRQRIGDIAAGTTVIHVAAPQRQP